MASLSKEELEEAQNTAIEWSAKTPPAAVQVDFAKKKAPGLMKDLVSKLWKQASMRIFILLAWKEEDEVHINGIDFNEKLEGNSFTDMKDWKPMLSEWNAYAGEEFGELLFDNLATFSQVLMQHGVNPDVDLNNDDDDSEGEVKKGRKKGKKKDKYPLEMDSYGLLIILDVKELNLKSKKCLIRMFLTKHYRLCSQQPKASVPWASVRKAQGDFIAAKFLPTGWKLDNPSKIQLADTDWLLELWCQRQKDQVRPTFEFKGWEGDNKTMRELAEAIDRKDSDTRPKDLVKKTTGKRTRRVAQELSSEDEEKDNEEEEKDNDDDNGTLPPPKSKPVKNHLLVKKSRPVNACSRASLATSAAEHEDPHPPVKKSRPFPLPPKSKPTKKCGRVGHIQSDLELDSQSPGKKSKPNNASTGSAQSTGPRDNHPPPSKSHTFGPTSGVHGKKKNHKGPVPKPTPAATKATGKKAKGREAQTTDHEPKRCLRSSKASYKAQYMQ
ncbi:uncharacterized protein BJ212DRAFT_1480234 [Suillus subaureus]|uniref:Uncharacterized protein n=1 Tax=Suillus subaureus TaxID=48587 RepID=A0A9P7ECW0_9AGAM|nr:uncharacterized protein BJ212DRAFT_1480234 [Suillus subaureus]KAG1817677.1 hypothetical protein BJ212DRAFT_1480234 [Suillus subaureus]